MFVGFTLGAIFFFFTYFNEFLDTYVPVYFIFVTYSPVRSFTSAAMQTEMTEVMLSVGVKAVTGTHLDLSDGSSMPYGLAVWAAGNGPLPLVLDLIETVNEQKEKASWGR